MGSDSDLPVMAKAAEVLEEYGVEYSMKILSAHRTPEETMEFAKTAEENGYKAIICAGMAAHLPGSAPHYPSGDWRAHQRFGCRARRLAFHGANAPGHPGVAEIEKRPFFKPTDSGLN